MKVDVEVDGVLETVHALEKVERGVVDFRQLGTWDAVQSEFYKIQKEIFDTEGGAGASGKWAALSSPYAEIKQKKYGSQPILQATGRLYREMTTEAGVAEKKEQEIVLGSQLPYGGIHNRGGGRVPQRRILDLKEEHQKRLVAPIKKKMEQLIDNAKLRDVRGF